jgi:MFS family permease
MTGAASRTGLRRILAGVGWWDTLVGPGAARPLAITALVDAAGTGLAAVCLPFFAVTVAGIGVGSVALTLSAMGVAELLATVPNGVAAARIGVRRFVVAAKLGEAAVFTGLAFVHGLPGFLVLAVLGGVARAGSSGLNQSLTVAVLGESQRSGALGAIRALRNIGYLLAGGAAAVLLATSSAGALRTALLVNAVSFLVGGAFLLRLRPVDRPTVPDRAAWSVLRDWAYLGMIACAAVFASSLVVLDLALPLWALTHRAIPRPTVAVVTMLNTLLVVLLQYRFSRAVDTVPDAVRGIRRACVLFVAMSLLIAASGWLLTPWAVAALLAAGILLTFAELLESPSWWTISYESAPEGRKTEYLATFDLSWSVVAIVGPAAMAAVVSLDALGWLLYAAVIALATVVGGVLATHRMRRGELTLAARQPGSAPASEAAVRTGGGME